MRNPVTGLPGVPAQRATRMAFFIAGFGMAAWAPLIPYAKIRLNLDDRILGLLLLCLGVGSIVTMPVAGALAARFGCRRLIVLAGSGIGFALPFLARAPNALTLGALLFVFGASVGTVDVVVNVQSLIVQKAARRPMMSGFHGFYSVGGIAGAAGMSALLYFGLRPANAVLVVAAVIFGLLAAFGRDLLPYASEGERPAFAIPHGIVLWMGGLTFVAFLAEGAMLDWSALLLTTLHQVPPARAGWGFAAFALAMTVGRLNGDRIVHRFGERRILIVGGLCAATGLAIVALTPSAALALAGFGLVGAGASNLVPVLYTILGRQKAVPTHLAIATVTTMGYCGILTGPALIGFVAHAASLPLAILGVGLMLLSLPASCRIADSEQ